MGCATFSIRACGARDERASLDVEDLPVEFATDDGDDRGGRRRRASRAEPARSSGIVGESGSGKIGDRFRPILRLVRPPGRI